MKRHRGGFRQPYRRRQVGTRRRRAPSTTALRRAGIIIPSISRGYLRSGGYYGRYSNGGELKFLDTSIDDALIAVGGTIQNAGTVNVIPQDVTESSRVGRKCTIKAIGWRYNIFVGSFGNVTNGTDTIRVILYLDKQCNGATIATTDLLQADDFQSFNNLSNSGRFRILMDRTHTLNATAGAGDGTTNDTASHSKDYTFFKKCSIPIEYDDSATTGAIGTIRTNNLGVLLVGAKGIGQFASVMRLRFSDG